MDYNIFKDDSEKEDAKLRLPELIAHPGWKYVVRALDKNYEHKDEQLNIRRDFASVDELYTLLDRRNDLRMFKQLPKLLLKEIQPDLVVDQEDDDVYDTPAPPPSN